ncbi:MAG: lipase maturation factor family protein [Acidimicrobiales bacterium]
MAWLGQSDLWLGRLVFQRTLAGIYLVAFVGAANQFRALVGEHGLTPIPTYLGRTTWHQVPSLLRGRYCDRRYAAVAWSGAVVSLLAVLGLTEAGPWWASALAWLVLWGLYLSIVNVGQTWWGFGWESLLLEAGFLAVLLGPSSTAPPVLLVWAIRWLLFRVELGAGLIKWRGDSCWRDLTCLRYHHESQPMPGPMSWWFHRLPDRFHKAEVAANHVTQLFVPWLLLLPQPLASVAAVAVLVTQGWLFVSGNFSWLNVLTMALALPALGVSVWQRLLPIDPPAHLHEPSVGQGGIVIVVVAAIALMSWWPVRNLADPGQRMNASYNGWHLVNTYGAFGSVTRDRFEVIIEGTTSPEPGAGDWREYGFRGKPGDPGRRPRQVAPYHLRLDWLLWFVSLSPRYGDAWLDRLAARLLEADRPTLRLLRTDPFDGDPPAAIRMRLFRYRYTTRAERRATGAWWVRHPVNELVGPVALVDGQLRPIGGADRGRRRVVGYE